jgi:hypothetical protein
LNSVKSKEKKSKNFGNLVSDNEIQFFLTCIMKYLKVNPIFHLFIIFGLKSCLLPLKISAQETVLSSGYTDNQTIPSGCTVFTISKGENVFFGGNDDYINPDSYYWVDPGDSVNYGVIWIGEPDNVQLADATGDAVIISAGADGDWFSHGNRPQMDSWSLPISM